MNDKVAKILRKLARDACAGNFQWKLVSKPNNPGTALNDPRTFRGIYRYFKRHYDPDTIDLR